MANQSQQTAPAQAPPAVAVGAETGVDPQQKRLGNAEVQSRMSGAGGGGGSQSGAEGGPGNNGGWAPQVQAKLSKLPPEAVAELEQAWAAYAKHVRSLVSAGWKQGWMGDVSLIGTKRTEVKLDWQEVAGPIKYPYPQVNTREPEEGDPMGICWDWSKDITKFLTGLGLKHWGAFPVERETPAHHAASLKSADGSVTIVFDGWANWQDPGQAQLEADWL